MQRHPQTGKPLITLKHTGVLSKDIRQLVWCSTVEEAAAAHKTVCAIAVSSFTVFEDAVKQQIPIYAYYCRDGNDIPRMAAQPTKPLLFIISRTTIPFQYAMILQTLGNILILEDIQSHLPFMRDYTFNLDRVGDIHVMVGIIHRVSHIITQEIPSEGAMKAVTDYSIKMLTSVPKKEIWLVQQFFQPTAGRRAKEIETCLQENLESGIFNRVLLLNEKEYVFASPRLRVAIEKTKDTCFLDIRPQYKKRLTYGDILRVAQEAATTANTDTIEDSLNKGSGGAANAALEDIYIVAANADITFDKNQWPHLHNCSLNNSILAILRHDMKSGDEPPKLFGFPGPSEESTDAWVFSAKAIMDNGILQKTQVMERFDKIVVGHAACDQAFVGELARNKFNIYNPAIFFRIFHHQLSGVSTALPIIPDVNVIGHTRVSGILDIHFDTNKIMQTPVASIQRGTVNVDLYSDVPKAVETFCIMEERHDRYKWQHNKTNEIKIPAAPIYEWTNCMMNMHGIIQDYRRAIIGSTQESAQLAEKAGVCSLQVTTQADTMWGIPIRPQTMSSFGRYFVEYFARALQLMKLFPAVDGQLVLPGPHAQDWVNQFTWPNGRPQIGATLWNPQTMFYCRRVVGTVDGPWFNEISTEDITTLRTAFKPYSATITAPERIVIIMGGFIDESWTAHLKELFTAKGYTPVVIDPVTASVGEMIAAFVGAGRAIVSGGGPESGKAPVDYSPRTFWSWMMPAGAILMEIQNEFNPDGEVVALCAAAAVKHHFMVIHRAPSAVQLTAVATRLEKIIEPFVTAPKNVIENASNITSLRFSI